VPEAREVLLRDGVDDCRELRALVHAASIACGAGGGDKAR
jgi:hypothetical protein